MAKLVKVIAGALGVTLLAVALAAWWYLHADAMDPPDLPGIEQAGSLEHDGLQRSWLAYIPASRPARPALGLEAPYMVAGIAAVAANLPVQSSFDCTRSGTAVATLIINGTQDPVNPYGGGLVEAFGDTSRGEVLSSDATAAYWARLAGHDGEGRHQAWPDRVRDDGTSVESTQWSLKGLPPVGLVTIVGGGHTFPHRSLKLPRILGPTSHELDGAEVIWSFFSGAETLALGVVPDR